MGSEKSFYDLNESNENFTSNQNLTLDSLFPCQVLHDEMFNFEKGIEVCANLLYHCLLIIQNNLLSENGHQMYLVSNRSTKLDRKYSCYLSQWRNVCLCSAWKPIFELILSLDTTLPLQLLTIWACCKYFIWFIGWLSPLSKAKLCYKSENSFENSGMEFIRTIFNTSFCGQLSYEMQKLHWLHPTSSLIAVNNRTINLHVNAA